MQVRDELAGLPAPDRGLGDPRLGRGTRWLSSPIVRAVAWTSGGSAADLDGSERCTFPVSQACVLRNTVGAYSTIHGWQPSRAPGSTAHDATGRSGGLQFLTVP